MKTFNRILIAAVAMMLFTACGTSAGAQAPIAQGNNPYAVQPVDGTMMRGEVRIDSANVSASKSNPAEVMLNFAYFQPTPCFRLRVEPGQPDAQNRINVSAYAVAPKDKACALMALSTPLQASLNMGSDPKGHYSVWLNGAEVGNVET